jgi:hypothetical protein
MQKSKNVQNVLQYVLCQTTQCAAKTKNLKLYRRVVYMHSQTNVFLFTLLCMLLLICTVVETCCFFVLLYKLLFSVLLYRLHSCLCVLFYTLAVYLFSCANLLFICTVVQTCCLFTPLCIIVVYLYCVYTAVYSYCSIDFFFICTVL